MRSLERVLDSRCRARARRARPRGPIARPRTRPRRDPRARGRFAARRGRATHGALLRAVLGPCPLVPRRARGCSRAPASPLEPAAGRRQPSPSPGTSTGKSSGASAFPRNHSIYSEHRPSTGCGARRHPGFFPRLQEPSAHADPPPAERPAHASATVDQSSEAQAEALALAKSLLEECDRTIDAFQLGKKDQDIGPPTIRRRRRPGSSSAIALAARPLPGRLGRGARCRERSNVMRLGVVGGGQPKRLLGELCRDGRCTAS